MAITTPNIVSSTANKSQTKFLAAKLITRARLRLVALGVCDPMKMEKGNGDTAYLVRFNRMNLPTTTLTEGTDPTQSTFTLSEVTVQLDQWGDVLAISDRAELTTFHPLVEQAIQLLSDNAQRVIDREVQVVWLAGTNIQYYDGTIASRNLLTNAHKITDTVIHKAIVTLVDAGAPPRGGPSGISVSGAGGGGASASAGSGVRSEGGGSVNAGLHYVGLAGPQVMHDIMQAGTSLGSWASVAMYRNQMSLYTCEVGTWLNVRWIETNFIPKFTLLGSSTAAVVSGNAFGSETPVVTAVDGGGTLTSGATYYYKVVRKDLTRGFAEQISVEHTTAAAATANNESFTFNFTGLTAGYVFDLYFGSATGDSNLKLHTANAAVGDTVTVTAVPTSTTTAPAAVCQAGGTGITVHPVYIHGEESCNFVGLQNLQVLVSSDQATTDNPLKLRKTIGYKFMGKAVLRDQTRMLRVEVYSAY